MWAWYYNQQSWSINKIFRVEKYCWVSRFDKISKMDSLEFPRALTTAVANYVAKFSIINTYEVFLPQISLYFSVGVELLVPYSLLTIPLLLYLWISCPSAVLGVHSWKLQYYATFNPVFGIIDTFTELLFVNNTLLRDTLSLVVISLSIISLKVSDPGGWTKATKKVLQHFLTSSIWNCDPFQYSHRGIFDEVSIYSPSTLSTHCWQIRHTPH